MLIDEKINEDDVENPQEIEANAYAIELLNGRPDAAFHSNGWISAEVLASEALRIGRHNKVDPGHVALNYAKTMGRTHTGNFSCMRKGIKHTLSSFGLDGACCRNFS